MTSKKKKMKTTTLKILEEISKFIDEIIEPITYSGLRQRCRFYYTENDLRRYPGWYHSNLESMERRKYIKINRKNDSVVLTNKGKIKLLENSDENTTDGKWRMLSWDIPEDYKVKRQLLCRSIKRIGYKKVQKSLWACPFAKADQVNLIIEELKLQKYIAYLRVDRTDIEKHLYRLFEKELKR
ncbi:hypothetical protein AUJ40_01505 [Candidatus Berkelbacteria bacterium CG1_02_42_45]|uniref:Transcriptional repressor PaaX-like central Cas2-like domain-containing protein n=3 Tax=Candidatus Berkelbacteria TaxID=1618330 RepID=A0A2M7K1R3_9BACT|nr:MAG: hypothetical protein AUJ40_01505 [Candidatus Berkelbacteria bacterium CG1_02_42_45]PIX30190.1 MAG: hypothetical protein COZ63_01060 [Candidatus Berkelbacteria bacterium CG_4_8_14_3_um_filter_42_13]